jgi:hypothetical protein
MEFLYEPNRKISILILLNKKALISKQSLHMR